MRRGLWYQVGTALDWPVGRRFFVHVDARLILFRVGIGDRDRLLNQTETLPDPGSISVWIRSQARTACRRSLREQELLDARVRVGCRSRRSPTVLL